MSSGFVFKTPNPRLLGASPLVEALAQTREPDAHDRYCSSPFTRRFNTSPDFLTNARATDIQKQRAGSILARFGGFRADAGNVGSIASLLRAKIKVPLRLCVLVQVLIRAASFFSHQLFTPKREPRLKGFGLCNTVSPVNPKTKPKGSCTEGKGSSAKPTQTFSSHPYPWCEPGIGYGCLLGFGFRDPVDETKDLENPRLMYTSKPSVEEVVHPGPSHHLELKLTCY